MGQRQAGQYQEIRRALVFKEGMVIYTIQGIAASREKMAGSTTMRAPRGPSRPNDPVTITTRGAAAPLVVSACLQPTPPTSSSGSPARPPPASRTGAPTRRGVEDEAGDGTGRHASDTGGKAMSQVGEGRIATHQQYAGEII